MPLARDIPLTLRKQSGWSPRALIGIERREKFCKSAGVHHDVPSYDMAFGEKTDIIYIYIYIKDTQVRTDEKGIPPQHDRIYVC